MPDIDRSPWQVAALDHHNPGAEADEPGRCLPLIGHWQS